METFVLFVILAISSTVQGTPTNGRVVGGEDAADGQFPFIISLRNSRNAHLCGGSLIRANWVITAAHCVAGVHPPNFTVVAGTHLLDSGGVSMAVEEVFVHPQWNMFWIINDIALLRLAGAFQENDLVQTIELATDQNDNVRSCTLIGWGSTSYPGTAPNNLQFLHLMFIPHYDCKTKLSHLNPVEPTQICTLTIQGEGACHGDSGGPVIEVVEGKTKLVGLVSWGSPCANGLPDVHTRVSSFYEWIQGIISA